MMGAAYKFVREVDSPQLIVKIFNIYLLPHIHYCTAIWMQDQKAAIKKVESIQPKLLEIQEPVTLAISVIKNDLLDLTCSIWTQMAPLSQICACQKYDEKN